MDELESIAVKRLAFITERFPPDIGGLAASAYRLSHSFARQDVAVDVVNLTRNLPGGVLQHAPKEVENFELYRIGRFRNWDSTISATMGVLDWLHGQHQYDAIWGHYLSPCGFLSTWFGELNGVKSIVSIRGNDLDREIFPPGDFARVHWTLQRAGLVTSASKDLATKSSALSGRKDIFVLKNCVDTDVFFPGEKNRELKSALGIDENEIVLGFCGELKEKKGLRFLLEALSYVRAKRPACLLLIGEARAQQQAELQLYAAEREDDAQRLIATGHIPDPSRVAEHLRICDLYLQPSILDGMPNALLEAMACKSLCITSDAGGIKEVIEHGKNGFLLPRAQLHNLGVAIMESCELAEDTLAGIKTAARETILNSHSMQQEHEALRELMGSAGF